MNDFWNTHTSDLPTWNENWFTMRHLKTIYSGKDALSTHGGVWHKTIQHFLDAKIHTSS